MNGEQNTEKKSGGFEGGINAQLQLRQVGQASTAGSCCGTSGEASAGCCGEVTTGNETSCCGEPITVVADRSRAASGGCCG